jgi:hypothetical protein
VNLLIRLTKADTAFLLERVKDAVARKTGVNFVLEKMPAAACIIDTKERGKQLAVNVYSDALTYRVTTPMQGYNGPWTHIEFVMEPHHSIQQLCSFIQQAKKIVEMKEVDNDHRRRD